MKKILISIFSVVLYFIIVSQVQAAGNVSLSTSKQTAYIGDTFNVSVNLSGTSVATLTARISFDTEKMEYVSGPSNSNSSNGRVIYTWTDPNGGASPITGGTIATFTFKAKSEGTAYFAVSGDFFTPDEVSANPSFSGVAVVVKKVENNTGGNNGGNTGDNTGTNTGGNTGGNTGTNSGGNVGGSTGGNTGTNTGTNQSNKSSNNNLKNLQINVEGISPRFNKNITQYYITIPENISNINITANPEDSKANVQITGNNNIPSGASKIRIIVTAENGNKKEYVINVTKTNNPELSNSNLENLAIENMTLVPEFNSDITDYTVEFFEDLDKLNILAVPQREAAKVTIEGNENLQYGDNVIKVTVLAEDGVSSKVYNVVAKKSEKIVENEEDKDLVGNVINEVDKKVENNNVVMFVGLGILAVLIVSVVVVIMKKKTGKMHK